MDLNYYQKVKGKVVVYVERMPYIYRTTLYLKGEVGVCSLEARIERQYGPQVLFELADSWLEKYHSGDSNLIKMDNYSIDNLQGVWGPCQASSKLYYLNNQEGFLPVTT
ncbi:hypothetical protein ACP26L_36240 (plasmid) [Paenibacillus sp. S-38]|uniref:hypothetical protein n=1 Tax=Paenibacillus sp. S-38 TaxID=3416710 RepID=UPI003CEDD1F4